jgi:hypothetical protein
LRHGYEVLAQGDGDALRAARPAGRLTIHALWMQGGRIRARALSPFAAHLARSLRRGVPLALALAKACLKHGTTNANAIQDAMRDVSGLLTRKGAAGPCCERGNERTNP